MISVWSSLREFIDINYLLWTFNLFFYFLFIKWNLKIFKIENKNKISIFFALLVITNPFYPLTILWPFYSGFFMTMFMYFTYLIFAKKDLSTKRFIKINSIFLLMSLTWPGFNHLIFIVITFIFFFVISFKKKIISFLFLILILIYPFKNYYLFGYFGPTSLSGFTNGLNTIWPWVSDEKRDQLLEEGKISRLLRDSIRGDFFSLYRKLLLKNNDELIKDVNEYSKKKKLPWVLDKDFNYLWATNKNKIHFLNDTFSKYPFIHLHEPAMVVISDHFNKIGISLLDDFIIDSELRDSLYKSIETRISGSLSAPDLYYKWYPIYQKSWQDLEKNDFNYPTLNIFKITAVGERDIRTPSIFSLISIQISVYIVLSLFLKINSTKKNKLITFFTICGFSIFIKLSIVFYFFSFFESIFLIFLILSILLGINKKISNKDKISLRFFEYLKLNYKLLIGAIFVIYSFVFSSYISLFEANRYFGIFSPIILPLIFAFLEFDKKDNKNKFQFKIL